ncbi:hypothetical protein EV191_102490 [Tamaricihabitans halophyticus]|uniref:Uncharacterized protein n=1 Tax=Tamaricihabitans halophyticus TaxID=1262583 RepID=A0A4R2R1B2_9PSEU|nr:alkaline shock response membrane anchor protein AmaP [Tamaricihabitans halophyticus]TCP55278.1 hypothetical protein EV191_102490 [Tamaricihabitans halophyticus]
MNAASALARSYRAERLLVTMVGLLALAGGAAVLVIGLGWLGTYRAARPLRDPIAVDWLTAHATPARIVALAAGLLLVVAGLWWLVRALRPEARPDLELDRTVGAELRVTAGALANAVGTAAASITGVTRARARVVGSAAAPALRLTLWLREGTSLQAVWAELDERVLAGARETLDLPELPAAVRLELDAGERRRVR